MGPLWAGGTKGAASCGTGCAAAPMPAGKPAGAPGTKLRLGKLPVAATAGGSRRSCTCTTP